MKTRTMLENLQSLFDPELRKNKARRKQFRVVLKQLKKRHRKLQEKLKKVQGKEARRKLKNEIQIICEQRRKGIRICREMTVSGKVRD